MNLAREDVPHYRELVRLDTAPLKTVHRLGVDRLYTRDRLGADLGCRCKADRALQLRENDGLAFGVADADCLPEPAKEPRAVRRWGQVIIVHVFVSISFNSPSRAPGFPAARTDTALNVTYGTDGVRAT
jgi:hypothetical protein